MTDPSSGSASRPPETPIRQRSGTEEASGRTRDRSRPPLPEPLPHPVVDNHCHLDIADAGDNDDVSVESLLADAASVGVPRVVQIGCDPASARWSVDLAGRHPGLVAGVALHPNEVPRLAVGGTLDRELAAVAGLAASSDRVRAVGETGLDHFRTKADGWAVQERSFRAHVALAKQLDKTLVVHDRDSHDDVLRVLDDEGLPPRTVMHCFSGDADFARACLERGAYLSFAGTVTFKAATQLREALAITPSDRLLVETDAPYLTPMPYRGRPNASYLVPVTVRAMADVLNRDLTELCQAIDQNTSAAYGGTW